MEQVSLSLSLTPSLPPSPKKKRLALQAAKGQEGIVLGPRLLAVTYFGMYSRKKWVRADEG